MSEHVQVRRVCRRQRVVVAAAVVRRASSVTEPLSVVVFVPTSQTHTIAIKHQVSIANVATRWVLQQESVGGVILGVRFGLTEHNKNNAKTFGFKLDDDDMARIEDAKKGTRNLYTAFGDCGGEYRRRG